MDFSILRSAEEFHQLTDEWNTLLTSSAIHVPFLRHEYLTSWWRFVGGGEWQDAQLFIALARQNNQLVGIAPFLFTKNCADVPALMLLGSMEISDYLDVLVRPADVSAFISELLECLAEVHNPPWQMLDLYNLLDNTPTLPALRLAAERMGWSFSQERLQPAPFIPLPGDWETYLAGIDKKQRHEIRRKIRRAEANSPAARWYMVNDPASLETEMDAFINLMAQDANKATFLTELMRAQMHDIARTAFEGGWLHLAFLEFGGQKAAAYMSFDYANHIWVYNSGINPDFAALSPGWVLLGYMIEWAIQNGRVGFDFMRGDEIYKYRFGAADRFVMRAIVQR